jgi:DNA ligase-1
MMSGWLLRHLALPRRKIMRISVSLFMTFLLCLLPHLNVLAAEQVAPNRAPVMLANVYHNGIDLKAYWVSEKYDGVRAYWDGKRLLTRGGEVIAPPAWFMAGWPNIAMDGELWAGRGRFAEAVSTVRRQTPDDAAWRTMRFMVFDLPAQGGTFDQRLPVLKSTVAVINLSWVQDVKQSRVDDHRSLQKMLKAITKEGGEGLMLHRGASLYRAERNDDLLKVKLHDDAEARVLAYIPGKGKHAGRLGALLVEMPNAQRFKLGTGFSDAQREQPPALGSVVTYRYRGVNDSGIPRFASFCACAKICKFDQTISLLPIY